MVLAKGTHSRDRGSTRIRKTQFARSHAGIAKADETPKIRKNATIRGTLRASADGMAPLAENSGFLFADPSIVCEAITEPRVRNPPIAKACSSLRKIVRKANR